MRKTLNATLCLLLGGALAGCSCGGSVNDTCDWAQWGQDPAHRGNGCQNGQPLSRALARVQYDPFAEQEQLDNADYENGIQGSLLVHYPTPLIAGDDVYVMAKAGSYVPCEPPGSGLLADGGEFCGMVARNTQTWTEKRFAWEGETLVEKWTVESDWKPAPLGITAWEPSFQPALAGDFLYLPALGGTLLKVDRHGGGVITRVDPFGRTPDPWAFVAGGLTVDKDGNVLYTVMELLPDVADANGYLVRVTPSGAVTKVPFEELLPGAPAGTDTCQGAFNTRDYKRPFPPVLSDGGWAPTPLVACSRQRPALNAAPAIAEDGTIYVMSRAHRNGRYGFLVAVTPDLKPKWAASLRDQLNDGCGVLNPAVAQPNPDGGDSRSSACRVGAPSGVDPATNAPPAAQVSDTSSSSPMVLPDGAVLYGAVTGYNGSRGHLMKFSAAGELLGTYDFGWDVTPAIWKHDGTYSIVIKDNHYFEYDGSASRFYITQLSKDLAVEWKFQNTQTESCTRQPAGNMTCTADHPDGFEWCINAPAVDPSGTVFTNAEDGFLYAISQGGMLKERFFLKLAIGAAYTPLALDRKGRIYALNGGELTVVGK